MKLQNDLADIIMLDGIWQFRPTETADWSEIRVPGCWEQQGYPKSLEGPVHYRCNFSLPADWSKRRLQIELDGASYHCAVECNGVAVGEHRGMWTGFAFDLTGIARVGKENQLDVYITKPGKRYPVRQSLAGFLPDLATTFGGLWQSVRISALKAGLQDVSITADIESGSIQARCSARLFERAGEVLIWRVMVNYHGHTTLRYEAHYDPAAAALDVTLPAGAVDPWEVDRPALYSVCIELWEGEECLAQVTRRVGFRQLAARGSQLMMNGRPFLTRGVLSWGWMPDRIAPNYSLEEARQEIRAMKAMGFNLLKLCLVIPNQAYFEAADEEGILLWVEYPIWLPEVTEDFRHQAPREYADITRMLHEHPSICLYSLGCEMNRSIDSALIERLDREVRERVNGALICDNSGSGESYGGLDSAMTDFTDYHPYYDLQYFERLLDHWRRDWQPARPWIFGEFCDADTFRDTDALVADLDGQRPWWMTTDNPVSSSRAENQALIQQQQRLKTAAPGFPSETIQAVSYAQAYLIRKYTLETLRRRAGMGGYVITGLRDTPISTSGLYDDLGRAKWPAIDFQTINSADILCLDVDRRRAWRNGGDRPDPIDPFAHWGGTRARWRIILHCAEEDLPEGGYVRWDLSGLPQQHQWRKHLFREAVPAGLPKEIGVIECAIPIVEQAVELRLDVKVKSAGRVISNSWPVWVYPPLGAPPSEMALVDPLRLLDDVGGWLANPPRWNSAAAAAAHGASVIVSPDWNEDMRNFVESGGKVILLQQSGGPLPARRLPFWREAVKLFSDHPVWNNFPHHGFTDMQFFGLATDLAFHTSQLPAVLPRAEFIPTLRRLDARAFHMTDYLFEARLGAGSLIATTLRLAGGAGTQAAGPHRNIVGQALLRAMITA